MKDEILGKYHFPILRFGTNESNERVKLVGKLEEIQSLKILALSFLRLTTDNIVSARKI